MTNIFFENSKFNINPTENIEKIYKVKVLGFIEREFIAYWTIIFWEKAKCALFLIKNEYKLIKIKEKVIFPKIPNNIL